MIGSERICGADLSSKTIAFTSVGHLMPVALPLLITKLIVFTKENYLEIVVNLLPWQSLFWSDIICRSLIELHNPWIRICTAPTPGPSTLYWISLLVAGDVTPPPSPLA